MILARPRPLAAAALFGALCVVTGEARAVEREQHLAIGAGPTFLKVDGRPAQVGVGMTLGYSYGLTDAWNLTAEASSAAASFNATKDIGKTTPAGIETLGLGASYVLDVLTWVPYGTLLVGGAYLHGGALDKNVLHLDVTAGVGLDYKLSFHTAVGLGIRQHMLFTNISTYPSYTDVFARFEYAWGR